MYITQGGEKYQAAYYVFEELAQASATQSVQSLVSQAVAELHLGRLEEAEAVRLAIAAHTAAKAAGGASICGTGVTLHNAVRESLLKTK